MDLIHAVDEFHNTLPAHVGVVVGVVQVGDSDVVANLLLGEAEGAGAADVGFEDLLAVVQVVLLLGPDADLLTEGELPGLYFPDCELDAVVAHELHRPVLSEELLDPALHRLKGVVAVLVVGTDLGLRHSMAQARIIFVNLTITSEL